MPSGDSKTCRQYSFWSTQITVTLKSEQRCRKVRHRVKPPLLSVQRDSFVNIEQYKRNRELRRLQEPRYRVKCVTCRQPEFSCYCRHVKSFDSKIEFVILIHPLEVRRRIATGRMSHLCLKNSHLIEGQDFSQNEKIARLVQDPNRKCMILYPGVGSTNLTPLHKDDRATFFKTDKILTFFVIDGTWRTARKMVRSDLLLNLPRVCFTPEKPSNFRVRKQPHKNCYSTIEAIHHIIELIGPANGFEIETREHDALIYAFDKMVEHQLSLMRKAADDPHAWRSLAPRNLKPLNI